MRVIDVTFKMGKNVLFLNDMRAYTIAINIGAWLKAITLLPLGHRARAKHVYFLSS